MLGEDLDIGFYAVDAYAAYVIRTATALQIVPDFSNARGATVDALFNGPFLTEAAFVEAATALRDRTSNLESSSSIDNTNTSIRKESPNTSLSSPLWERLALATPDTTPPCVVVLHAWIEKLNGPRKIQLLEPVYLLSESGTISETRDLPCGMTDSDGENRKSTSPTSSHLRVLSNLDFLLHLSTRNPLLGESSASQGTLDMDKFGAPLGIDVAFASGEREEAEKVEAARAARDALEQRDDVALARNAVDTVLKFAKLAEEHAGETATVYLDADRGEEYLQFES